VADSSGNLFIADSYNNMIREINTSQVVSTLAGSTTHGTTNGAGVTALFYRPTGIAMDASDNLYVADSYNDMIRLIAPGGVVSTLAGSAGVRGSANGPVSQATFYRPTGIAVDANDNIYVVDTYNNLIREISGGVVSTLAGSGKVGHANGTGIAATFNHPSGIALDLLGNIYVADTGNSMIRKITPQGVVTTLAGDLIPGSTNGYGTHSRFYFPSGLVFVAPDLLYVADSNNDMIRLVQLDQ
jgi:sugar lactone lactonase YvrE